MGNRVVLEAHPPIDAEVEGMTSRPWNGCGTSQDITGCRFSLSVMADDFAQVIVGAIAAVDTGGIWSQTDAIGTVYRGRRVDVIDAVQACFALASREHHHVVMDGTFSWGCPGDSDEDSVLQTDEALRNIPRIIAEGLDPVVQCAYFLAPMGDESYMASIAYAVNLAIKRGVYERSAHYVSILEGRLSSIMAYFNEVLAYCQLKVRHVILHVTMSAYSPSVPTEIGKSGHAVE